MEKIAGEYSQREYYSISSQSNISLVSWIGGSTSLYLHSPVICDLVGIIIWFLSTLKHPDLIPITYFSNIISQNPTLDTSNIVSMTSNMFIKLSVQTYSFSTMYNPKWWNIPTTCYQIILKPNPIILLPYQHTNIILPVTLSHVMGNIDADIELDLFIYLLMRGYVLLFSRGIISWKSFF